MLKDKFLIRVKYDNGEVGYSCATTPSYIHADSVHKPFAAIALFTKRGAELNVKALMKNWKYRNNQDSRCKIPNIEIISIVIKASVA